jgi:hypothetical protein
MYETALPAASLRPLTEVIRPQTMILFRFRQSGEARREAWHNVSRRGCQHRISPVREGRELAGHSMVRQLTVEVTAQTWRVHTCEELMTFDILEEEEPGRTEGHESAAQRALLRYMLQSVSFVCLFIM